MPAKIHDEKEPKRKEEKTIGDGQRGSGDSIRLVNKDFRLVDQEEIPQGQHRLSSGPNIPEDERGKIHEHLMSCAYPWLKEGVCWRCMSNNHYYQGSYAPDLLAFSSSV